MPRIKFITSSSHYLTWWPWPLTYDLDLWSWPRYSSTWPTYQKSGPYVCPFAREIGSRQTHTQIDRQCQNYVADAGCKKEIGKKTLNMYMVRFSYLFLFMASLGRLVRTKSRSCNLSFSPELIIGLTNTNFGINCKALENISTVLVFAFPQHFTHFRWTFMVDFFSAVYHPQGVRYEKISSALTFSSRTSWGW